MKVIVHLNVDVDGPEDDHMKLCFQRTLLAIVVKTCAHNVQNFLVL